VVGRPRKSDRLFGYQETMKEDVLEQIVDDYLNLRGYFTTHNVSFKPSTTHVKFEPNADSVPSDIDVIGYRPRGRGRARVQVINCKSWQRGFNPIAILEQLKGQRSNPKRARWHQFRELWIPKWSEAFRDTVYELTGRKTFEYRIAFTRLSGTASLQQAEAAWRADRTIATNLAGSSFGFLPLDLMWGQVLRELTTTPAPSELGRLAQLLNAAGLTAPTSARQE
jgi:hypothetical protein